MRTAAQDSDLDEVAFETPAEDAVFSPYFYNAAIWATAQDDFDSDLFYRSVNLEVDVDAGSDGGDVYYEVWQGDQQIARSPVFWVQGTPADPQTVAIQADPWDLAHSTYDLTLRLYKQDGTYVQTWTVGDDPQLQVNLELSSEDFVPSFQDASLADCVDLDSDGYCRSLTVQADVAALGGPGRVYFEVWQVGDPFGRRLGTSSVFTTGGAAGVPIDATTWNLTHGQYDLNLKLYRADGTLMQTWVAGNDPDALDNVQLETGRKTRLPSPTLDCWPSAATIGRAAPRTTTVAGPHGSRTKARPH